MESVWIVCEIFAMCWAFVPFYLQNGSLFCLTKHLVINFRQMFSCGGWNYRLIITVLLSSFIEEEIDVVTITDKQNSKKRNYSTASLSTPSSRQASPTHMPSTKKRKGHSKRMHRLNSSGSNFGGDGTESDDEQRRASHNVLERKRRNDLKYSFQILRGQIPELEDNQRAPKVTILKKAAEYIKEIREKEEDMQSRLAREVRRESKLLQRLAYLKSMPWIPPPPLLWLAKEDELRDTSTLISGGKISGYSLVLSQDKHNKYGKRTFLRTTKRNS